MIDSQPNITTPGLVYCIDPANIKSYSPNSYPTPVDLFTTMDIAPKSSCTIIRDTIQSPVGSTPLKMTITGSPAVVGTTDAAIYNIMPAVQGDVVTLSVYMKATSALTPRLLILEANSSNLYIVGALTQTPTLITQDWRRYSITRTITNASTAFIQIRLDGDYDVTSGSIWFDGLQVEKSSSMTEFKNKYNPNLATISDIGGNSIANTITGTPSYSSSGQGSLIFNGTSQFLQSSSSVLYSTEDLTLSAWVRFSTVPNATQIINIGKDGSGSGWGARIEALSSGTGFKWNVVNNGINKNTSYTLPSTIVINTWYYLSLVYRQGNTVKGYINGQLLSTSDATSDTVIRTSTVGFQAGRATLTSDTYFPIILGHTMIYRKALSDAEQKQNFEALRGRYGI